MGWGVLWGEPGHPGRQSPELLDYDASPEKPDCAGGPSNAVGEPQKGPSRRVTGSDVPVREQKTWEGGLVSGVQVKRVEFPDWADWVKRCLGRQWGSWQLSVCGERGQPLGQTAWFLEGRLVGAGVPPVSETNS